MCLIPLFTSLVPRLQAPTALVKVVFSGYEGIPWVIMPSISSSVYLLAVIQLRTFSRPRLSSSSADSDFRAERAEQSD